MTKSMKSLMMGAALAGLMTGSSVMAQRTTAAAKAFSSNTYLGHQVSFSDKDKHRL